MSKSNVYQEHAGSVVFRGKFPVCTVYVAYPSVSGHMWIGFMWVKRSQ